MAGEVPDCLFCDVADRRVQAEIVWADDVAVAFLDHRPLFVGHTLVVPRRHVVTLDELESEEVGPFFERVKWLSAGVRRAVEAQGTFVANNNVVSQSVAHLHVHVVPRTRGDGLRGFFWPRTRYEPGEAERVGEAIRVAVRGLAEGATGADR